MLISPNEWIFFVDIKNPDRMVGTPPQHIPIQHLRFGMCLDIWWIGGLVKYCNSWCLERSNLELGVSVIPNHNGKVSPCYCTYKWSHEAPTRNNPSHAFFFGNVYIRFSKAHIMGIYGTPPPMPLPQKFNKALLGAYFLKRTIHRWFPLIRPY